MISEGIDNLENDTTVLKNNPSKGKLNFKISKRQISTHFQVTSVHTS